MPIISVYLAGPEVFLADARGLADAKKRLCAAHGLTGIHPLDDLIDLDDLTPRAAGLAIHAANRAKMARADACIANLTPFRGPSADAGTVLEVGVMRGLGKPVLGYSNVTAPYLERAAAMAGPATRDASGRLRDRDGLEIEAFALADNLMIDGALEDCGWPMDLHAAAPEALYMDLTAFRRCIERLADQAAAGVE